MKGDGEDTVGEVEGFLDAVAVVNVDVDIQNSWVISDGVSGLDERSRWRSCDVREKSTHLKSSKIAKTISFT